MPPLTETMILMVEVGSAANGTGLRIPCGSRTCRFLACIGIPLCHMCEDLVMANELTSITGVGPELAKRLARKGFTTIPRVAGASAKALSEVQGLSEATAAKVIADAKKARPAAKKAASKARPAAKKAAAKPKRPGKKPGGKRPRPSDARVAKLEKSLAKAQDQAKKARKQAKKNAKAIAKLKKQLKKKKNK